MIINKEFISHKSRNKEWERDKYTCNYCNSAAERYLKIITNLIKYPCITEITFNY